MFEIQVSLLFRYGKASISETTSIEDIVCYSQMTAWGLPCGQHPGWSGGDMWVRAFLVVSTGGKGEAG